MTTEVRLRIGPPVMMGGVSRPVLDVGLRAAAPRWSWDERGPASAQIDIGAPGLADVVGPLAQPVNLPLRGSVEMSVGRHVVWEGYIGERTRGAGGMVRSITARGYYSSLSDRWWTRSDDDTITGRTSGEVLQTALRELTPWLEPDVIGDLWIDPMITYPGGMDDVTKLTVAQIADGVRQAGDSRGYPLWVMCTPSRKLSVRRRIAPHEPNYRIAFDDRIQRWTESDEGMAASVTVERGTASSGALGAPGTNAEFASSYGFAPEVIVAVGDIAAGQADAIRNAELLRRSRPKITATIHVSADPRTWLTTRHGVPVPYWMPRIGEWVGVAGEPLLPIVAISVDAQVETATYELGEMDPYVPGRLTLVARQTAENQRQMRAPAGGRLR